MTPIYYLRYEGKLEFSEEWGSNLETILREGYGNFLKEHMIQSTLHLSCYNLQADIYIDLTNIPHYSCAVRRMSYKMGSVSSFWCHICACKFMLAYIYHAFFRAGAG